MSEIRFQQIFYRLSPVCPFDSQKTTGFWPIAWSYSSLAALGIWHQRTEPWLRTHPAGTPDHNIFYGVFGGDAVLIHRDQAAGAVNAMAHLLIGPRESLTPELALQLRDLDPRVAEPFHQPVPLDRLAPQKRTLTRDLRAPEVDELLSPVLSQVMAGPRPIVLPALHRSPALLWALQEILTVLREGLRPAEAWPLSFETYDDRPQPTDREGLFLRFRPDVAVPGIHPMLKAAAEPVAAAYLEGGTNGVRALLRDRGALDGTSVSARIGIMARSPFVLPTSASPPPFGVNMPLSPPLPPPPQDTEVTGPLVSCPVCLGRLSWSGLEYFRYDIDLDDTVPLQLSTGASPEQRARELRNALVRCPNPGQTTEDHYLPANYGAYGPPAVFGFIGASQSGKTHLMATMIAAIVQGGFGAYGLSDHPIDLGRHERVMRELVRPLLNQSHKIASTRQGVVQFVDGFVLSGHGVQRPMALFDVAGSELTDIDGSKRFLDVADGLIFVVDPHQFGQERLGDVTFGTVLNLLRDSGRLSQVSAAVVLNKADLLKFEDPVARWIRHGDEALAPDDFLEESADVYAYLYQRGARAWTRPYDECPKATLHVASALGSENLVGGVRPQRVLRPLVSLLAMTGLLNLPGATSMGV